MSRDGYYVAAPNASVLLRYSAGLLYRQHIVQPICTFLLVATGFLASVMALWVFVANVAFTTHTVLVVLTIISGIFTLLLAGLRWAATTRRLFVEAQKILAVEADKPWQKDASPPQVTYITIRFRQLMLGAMRARCGHEEGFDEFAEWAQTHKYSDVAKLSRMLPRTGPSRSFTVVQVAHGLESIYKMYKQWRN
ncbi:MAG TPA: hypothetical protein VLG40_03435 [Candidatus Saccharimonas sp.]|nr:hypothetical protein [Candidatus Saccharimonas sp.]